MNDLIILNWNNWIFLHKYYNMPQASFLQCKLQLKGWCAYDIIQCYTIFYYTIRSYGKLYLCIWQLRNKVEMSIVFILNYTDTYRILVVCIKHMQSWSVQSCVHYFQVCLDYSWFVNLSLSLYIYIHINVIYMSLLLPVGMMDLGNQLFRGRKSQATKS